MTYANGAFRTLYGQPWQMYRQASLKLLGLIKQKNGWPATAYKPVKKSARKTTMAKTYREILVQRQTDEM